MDLTKTDFISLAAALHPERGDLFAKSPMRIIGVRGANDSAGQQNSYARYDDQIVTQLPGEIIDGGGIRAWTASTDPSWSLVVNPIVSGGAAQLRPGIHLFERHLMHAGTPREHWCLGQAEDVYINRLNNDGTVNHQECGQFGICIHSGGEGMDTGRFSAGCQIIQNNDGYFQDPTWSRFWFPIRDTMIRLNLSTIPYLLLNKSDIPQ